MSQTHRLITPILIMGSIILLINFAIRASFGVFQIPIANEFGWAREEFSLALAIQNLAWGIGQPIFGAIADKLGDRKAIILGALVYAAGLVLSAFATSPEAHQVYEFLVGFGIAGTGFGVILAIVGRASSDQHRSMSLAIATAAGSAGQVVGPLLAQLLLSTMPWQTVFLLFAGIILATLLLLPMMRVAPRAPKAEGDAPLSAIVGRAMQDSNYILSARRSRPRPAASQSTRRRCRAPISSHRRNRCRRRETRTRSPPRRTSGARTRPPRAPRGSRSCPPCTARPSARSGWATRTRSRSASVAGESVDVSEKRFSALFDRGAMAGGGGGQRAGEGNRGRTSRFTSAARGAGFGETATRHTSTGVVMSSRATATARKRLEGSLYWLRGRHRPGVKIRFVPHVTRFVTLRGWLVPRTEAHCDSRTAHAASSARSGEKRSCAFSPVGTPARPARRSRSVRSP